MDLQLMIEIDGGQQKALMDAGRGQKL